MELVQTYSALFYGILSVLAVMLVLCLIRAVKGPRIADRLVAVNMMGTMVMVMIALLAVVKNQGYLIDICLIYAMISFLAVVVLFQPRLQAPQNGHGGLQIRLFHHHRPKTPVQRRVLLNIFPVLRQGGGSQHLQFPTAKSRLENIGRVDSTLRSTGAYDGVHLIHEKDHILCSADLCQHIPEPFFKLATVFGACHKVCHVEANQALIL